MRATLKMLTTIFFIVFGALQAVAGNNTYLFLHGGPGLSSFPDSQMFGPLMEQKGERILFWDEPRRSDETKPQITYNDVLASVEQKFIEVYQTYGKVSLMTHSFAAHYAWHLAQKYPKSITKIIFIAPALDINEVDANVAKKNLLYYREHDATKFAHLGTILDNLKPGFNQDKIDIFTYAFTNPTYFLNYFVKVENMQQFLSYLVGDNALDFPRQISIRQSIPANFYETSRKSKVRVYAFYGSDDFITTISKENDLHKKLFKSVKRYVLPGARHFLHVENFNEFYNILSAEN